MNAYVHYPNPNNLKLKFKAFSSPEKTTPIQYRHHTYTLQHFVNLSSIQTGRFDTPDIVAFYNFTRQSSVWKLSWRTGQTCTRTSFDSSYYKSPVTPFYHLRECRKLSIEVLSLISINTFTSRKACGCVEIRITTHLLYQIGKVIISNSPANLLTMQRAYSTPLFFYVRFQNPINYVLTSWEPPSIASLIKRRPFSH